MNYISCVLFRIFIETVSKSYPIKTRYTFIYFVPLRFNKIILSRQPFTHNNAIQKDTSAEILNMWRVKSAFRTVSVPQQQRAEASVQRTDMVPPRNTVCGMPLLCQDYARKCRSLVLKGLLLNYNSFIYFFSYSRFIGYIKGFLSY